MGLPKFKLPKPGREFRSSLLKLGKKFPEEKLIPGYREFEPKVRSAVRSVRKRTDIWGEVRQNLRDINKELKKGRK